MSKLSDIEEQALQLPEEDKASLVNSLLLSSEPASSVEVEEAWASEITQRIGRLDRGESETTSATDVFSELDQKFA